MKDIIDLMPVPVLHKNIGNFINCDDISILKSAELKTMRPISSILCEASNEYIMNEINKWTNYFAHNIIGIEEHLSIETNEVLLIKTPPGNQLSMHDHPNSILSAVYYFEDAPESSPLVLYIEQQNIFKKFDFLVGYQKTNRYNESYYEIHPKKGDLVIFPSWIPHFNPTNMTEQPRYSLASQTWLRGNIPSTTKTRWERYSRAVRVSGEYYAPDLEM